MTNSTVPHLLHEYKHQKSLFESQPVIIQRFLEGQAQIIADALISKTSQVKFSLPDRVAADTTLTISETKRQNTVGFFLQRDAREALIRRLNELESSTNQAVTIGSGLLRYAAALHMIHNLLPAGRSVTYRPDAGEDIPTIPVEDNALESAITQASDAIVETGEESSRGEVQTPFVPAARRFFLPQWVAFDGKGKLLVGSMKEAEAHVQSMQRYVMILHRALSLAPYISTSEEYQRKRYGILGQLINQGRALANFNTQKIIQEVKLRTEQQTLNRGLSITLPYFDDQNLEMEEAKFDVVPAGRIMFIPIFLVRASQGEQAKVAQDTRLNASTRKHLLSQLKSLETAFLF